jgi:putative aldouronate transport system substrate-binding protein
MARNWKVVSVVLVLAMLFGMALAGCGNNGGDENSTTQTTDQTTTAAEQALEPVELTWYMCLNATQPDQDKVFEAANKMIKEKINATVKFIVSDAGS